MVIGSMLVKLNIFFILMLTFNHVLRGRIENLCDRFKHQKIPHKKRGYNSLSDHSELIEEDLDEQISQELE